MKPLSARDPFKIGMVALASAAALALVVVAISVIPFGAKSYSAMLAQTAGLRVSEDVKVHGVPVGQIKGITMFPESGRRTIPIDRNNFAPRLGFAYSPDSKTVIRGGAGIYYGANMQTNFQYTGPAYFKNAVSYFTKDNYQTQ